MKLLIVEDELRLLKSLEEFASKEGFIFDSANDFQSARERISLYDYDCIVLDINLPVTYLICLKFFKRMVSPAE